MISNSTIKIIGSNISGLFNTISQSTLLKATQDQGYSVQHILTVGKLKSKSIQQKVSDVLVQWMSSLMNRNVPVHPERERERERVCVCTCVLRACVCDVQLQDIKRWPCTVTGYQDVKLWIWICKIVNGCLSVHFAYL